MEEAYSIESRLALSSNVEGVLEQLIDQFESFDRLVKDSQEVLTNFAREIGEIGKEGGGIRDIFAGLKIPQSVLPDLAQVCEFGKGFASSSLEAATAWKEIAAASKSIRNPPPPPGASDGNAGSGGSDRKGGATSGAGKDEDGNSPFGSGDDYQNAVWQNSDFDVRTRQQKQQAEASVFGTPDERRTAAQEDADWEAKQRFIRQQANEADEARHRSVFGTPEERANAKLEDDDYNARKRFQERQNRPLKDDDHGLSHHDLGHAGMGLQMAGDSMTDFFEKAIMAGFDYEHLFAIISADTRVTPDQQKDLRSTIDTTSRNVPGSTRSETLEVFTDLKNTFGDFDEAKAELEPMLKLVTTLRMADLKQGGDGNMHQALSLARFIEDQGGAIDPATGKYDARKFDEIAQRAVSIYVATQGRVAPSDMLSFQKTGRTGGMMMDDHALYDETPYFAQAFGASKLGTAIFSDVQVMLANRMTDKTANELGDLGMYGGKKVVGKGKKAHLEWDQSTLKDEELLRHDPYAWIHDVLGAQIAKKLGVDAHTKEGQEAVIMMMTQLAQRGTIAGLWGDVYRNYQPAQKEGRNIEAQNPDMQNHFLQEDPMAQLLVFHAAENELMVTIGELLKGPALQMLQQMTSALHGLADTMNANPNLAKELTETIAEAGMAAKVLGAVAMAGFFIGPVFKLIGGIATIARGLGGLTAAFVPFETGGVAAAGLAGLETGVAGLGGGILTAAASGLTSLLIPLGAIAGLAKIGSDHENAQTRAAREQLRRNMGNGLSPTMLTPQDGFGPDGRPLANNITRPSADSLVSPTAHGPKGTAEDPVVVHVMNQPSGSDIARGVTSHQSRQLNRPPSGYTGSDITIDPLSAFYGSVP